MADSDQPKDGTQGDPTKEVGAGSQPPEPAKTFTQEQLDRIVEDRLKRERAQFADYDDLKAKAAKLDEAEEAQKTELQKAKDAAAEAKTQGEAAIARANATLIRAEVMQQATALGAVDPDVVVALLAGSEDIVIGKDGNVAGAKAAVEKLIKDKPYLGKAEASTSGGEFGGIDNPKSRDAKIRELEAKGDRGSLAEARRLKMISATATTS